MRVPNTKTDLESAIDLHVGPSGLRDVERMPAFVAMTSRRLRGASHASMSTSSVGSPGRCPTSSSVTLAASPAPGDRIDRFIVVGSLGAGAMGMVVAAYKLANALQRPARDAIAGGAGPP